MVWESRFLRIALSSSGIPSGALLGKQDQDGGLVVEGQAAMGGGTDLAEGEEAGERDAAEGPVDARASSGAISPSTSSRPMQE